MRFYIKYTMRITSEKLYTPKAEDLYHNQATQSGEAHH